MSSRRLGRLALGAALAALLLFLFFRGVDWAALGTAFRAADRWDLVGVVLASVLTYAIRAWRWGDLLAPLVRVPYWRLFSATFVGFMAGLLVPRAGEVVRPYLIGRRHGIPVSAAFASIILERLVDLVTVLVLFALYLYVIPAPAAQTSGPVLGLLKVGGALTGLAALAVGGLLLAFHVHAERTMRFADRLIFRLPERIASPASRALRAFGQGLAVVKAPPGHLLLLFGQSLLVWLTIALGVHLSYRAFGIALPFHASFVLIVFLTVGVAIPTPGMVGGFHEAYKLALTQVFHVAPDTAVAAGLAMHFLTNLPVMVIGLTLLGREGLTLGKVTEMSETPPQGDAPPVPAGRPPEVLP